MEAELKEVGGLHITHARRRGNLVSAVPVIPPPAKRYRQVDLPCPAGLPSLGVLQCNRTISLLLQMKPKQFALP